MNNKLTHRIFLFQFLVTSLITAQSIDNSTVFVSTSSVTQIPADNIFFAVTLSVQNEDAKEAHAEHKVLEKNLIKIFGEFEFADSNIRYLLLNIRKSSPYSKDKPSYKTHQIISIMTDDFNKYETLQLALLSNGIYEYRAKFTSAGGDEWIEKGIAEALSKATKEAEMTAKQLGKELGKVLEIESSHHYPSTSDGITVVSVAQPGESLIDLPRFVQMRVSMRVRFELLEKD